MKAYTLGIHGFVRRGILTAVGAPNHRAQAHVVIVAATKAEAARIANEYCGCWVTMSDPEFRVADSPFAKALLAHAKAPQVYVTQYTPRNGSPVVAVDDAGPRRVGTTGPGGTFVPDEEDSRNVGPSGPRS